MRAPLYDRDGLRVSFEALPDGRFAVHYDQDCESAIEANKTLAGIGRAHYAADPDMWKVASIPIVVQYKWLHEYGIDIMNRDHWPAVKRLLNDPEWRYLKTAEVII